MPQVFSSSHYNDVIMSTMASPITNLMNVYSRRRSKKTSKLRVTGLCAGNSPVTGEFPAQRASNAENVIIWWRHHGVWACWHQLCCWRIKIYWVYLQLLWNLSKLQWVQELMRQIRTSIVDYPLYNPKCSRIASQWFAQVYISTNYYCSEH